MGTLNDLQTLVRLLEEFELPVSQILQYAIKEKMESLHGGQDTIEYDSIHRIMRLVCGSMRYDSLNKE